MSSLAPNYVAAIKIKPHLLPHDAETSEAFIYVAMGRLMVRRLARS